MHHTPYLQRVLALLALDADRGCICIRAEAHTVGRRAGLAAPP